MLQVIKCTFLVCVFYVLSFMITIPLVSIELHKWVIGILSEILNNNFFSALECYTCNSVANDIDLCINNPENETLPSFECNPEFFGDNPFCYTKRLKNFNPECK